MNRLTERRYSHSCYLLQELHSFEKNFLLPSGRERKGKSITLRTPLETACKLSAEAYLELGETSTMENVLQK